MSSRAVYTKKTLKSRQGLQEIIPQSGSSHSAKYWPFYPIRLAEPKLLPSRNPNQQTLRSKDESLGQLPKL